MESYEYTLPIEKWWQILANVSHRDLCNVVLTSRHMNSVASLPELWAGMKVSRMKMLENGLAEFYNINRFKNVKQINFMWWQLKFGELERLLNEIPLSPLENSNLGGNNLSEVSAELLASAVSHLHIVNLRRSNLTTDQCFSLLKASVSSITLKNVNLDHVDLSEVPAELLAISISRLQDVELSGTYLTNDQCVALLKASLSSSTLMNVHLDSVDLSEVPADLLASSISRLQEVNISRTDLTTNQCVALLKASLSSTTLRNINLLDNNLSEVPAEILATSVSRLEEVNLCRTDLTTNQCVGLLKASLSSTTLRIIKLLCVNLSEVPSELLASSISRLQEVKLSETYLTTDQCVALLKAIRSSTTLHHIDPGGNDITQRLPTDQLYLLASLPVQYLYG